MHKSGTERERRGLDLIIIPITKSPSFFSFFSFFITEPHVADVASIALFTVILSRIKSRRISNTLLHLTPLRQSKHNCFIAE